jgi:hypothetical protein
MKVLRLPKRTVARTWKPLNVAWVQETKDRPICDYPNFTIKLEAYSQRAIRSLQPFLEKNGELLTLKGLRGIYTAYHLLRTSRAINISRSELAYDKADRTISYIWRAVFKRRMIESFNMFRVQGNYSHVFVKEAFMEAVQKATLTGFHFSECEVD